MSRSPPTCWPAAFRQDEKIVKLKEIDALSKSSSSSIEIDALSKLIEPKLKLTNEISVKLVNLKEQFNQLGATSNHIIPCKEWE